MDRKSYDVIVLGAGPAGLAAAITARQNGLETLVMERRPQAAIRPGESLHPGLEPPFKQLGISKDIERLKLHRNRGHRVQKGAAEAFIPYGADESGPWYGYQLRREDLNRILSDRAEQLGATVLYDCPPTAPLVEGGGVRGIRSARAARAARDEFRSQITIDATGSRRWLARKLGLETLFGSPRLFASYCYESCRDAPDNPVFSYRSQGWGWRAKIGEGELAVVDLDLSGAQVPQRPARGADVTWEKVPASAGPGYFLVGDAAGKLDPACGNGVLRAFMTAMLAASTAAAIIADPEAAAQKTDGYRQWHGDWLKHDAQRLAEIYRHSPFELDWPQEQDGNLWLNQPLVSARLAIA